LVRSKGGVDGVVMPLIHPQVGSDVMQAVEYIDSVRENRTGVTRYNQGLDANSLNKTATGVNSIMNAAQQRIELIARIFAETGVKHLMLIIHALSLKHSQKEEIIRLRNTWVPINPRSWKRRTDMSISVGLGTGNKDQILQHLTMIWQMQTAGMHFGIANPGNLFETARRLTQNAGFKQTEKFWSDPSQNPPQPPQPDPALAVEQMKQQGAAQLKQMDLQDSAQKFQAEQQTQMMIDQNRQEWEARQKQLELQQEAQLEQIKQQGVERTEAMRLEFERWKAELDARVSLRIAQIGTEQSGDELMNELSDIEVLDKPNPMEQLAAMHAQTLQVMASLAQTLARPKQIVRNPQTGRAEGIA
jgi:hypothetical protein